MPAEPSLELEFTRERKRRARDYFQLAHRMQRDGIVEPDADTRHNLFRGAIAQYRRSLDFYPTPEAHTFLGWAFSFLGNFKAAIAACQQAIVLDPEYGNPYNDIGVYLIEQGRYDHAIPYLQQAVDAKRYDCYHYAHYNLGRVLLLKGQVGDAVQEFERALKFEPQYNLALAALEHIRERPGALPLLPAPGARSEFYK